MASATPDLRLPFQSQSITAVPLGLYQIIQLDDRGTMFVNDLPMVAVPKARRPGFEPGTSTLTIWLQLRLGGDTALHAWEPLRGYVLYAYKSTYLFTYLLTYLLTYPAFV